MEEVKTKSQSSIEIAKNSRGVTWTVKAYGDTKEEIDETLKSLIEKAQNVASNIELQEAAK